MKRKISFVVLVLIVTVAASLTLACGPREPDSNVTFWFNESIYRTGLLRYTGMVFINENTAQIVYFDENNVMHIDKGEYVLLDYETFTGSFFYNSMEYYRLRFAEVYEYNFQPESPFPLSEDDIKDALFREGGTELLFRLNESALEVFGFFRIK